MPPGWVLVGVVGLVVLATTLATGPRVQRAIALAVAIAGMGLPWTLPPDAWAARAAAGLLSLAGLMKTWDLVREHREVGIVQRALHAVSIADTRRLERVAPSVDLRCLVAALFYLVLAAVGAAGVMVAPSVGRASAGWTLRWLSGAVVLYGVIDAVAALAQAVYAAGGFRAPWLQNRPILARSLGEFWGRRWNGAVSRWVSAHCFRPLARRGAGRWGIALAFVWSAFLHFYPTWVALGWLPAGGMAAFFGIQGVLVLLERPLRLASWPRIAQHTWTALGVIVPAPLLLEPTLTALGLPPSGPLL